MYEQQVIDILKASDRPLRHSEIVALADPDNKDWRTYHRVAAALSKLARSGQFARERAEGGVYRYTYAEQPAIQPGYTWQDDISPIRVMAVADGYAMVRRPGCLPFVVALAGIATQVGGKRER